VRYRPRWPWLALAALGGLGVLAAVVWVALWSHPARPARVVVVRAGYADNLAVPPNPEGTNLAHLLTGGAALRLTRPGPGTLLPELDGGSDRCVVVVVAAHGGRDRDGAFLFPDDAGTAPADRVRLRAVLDRLAALPHARHKFLVLDATEPAAFPDLGLVHNDFASAVEELEGAIAAVPNLVVLVSSGPDQRSWPFPERGVTAFGHHLHEALSGAADLDGDRRVTGWELAEYVRPRVRAWARDQRAALQEPVLLPRGPEGEARSRAMHLATIRLVPAGQPQPPTPFEPPPELRRAWEEYRDLAAATPPPEAYTPHLWRQYEAWALRHERHVLAADADGAATCRGQLAKLHRRIEADRRLPVRPQSIALPAAVGNVSVPEAVPEVFADGIRRVADPKLNAADRAKEWEKVRAPAGYGAEAAGVLWAAAFIRHVAENPADRLESVRNILPLLDPLFPVRPAELHFLAMLANHLPSEAISDAGPLLKQVLELRLQAERAAGCLPAKGYAYADTVHAWVRTDVTAADTDRRQAEDLCFSASPADRVAAAGNATAATSGYRRAAEQAGYVRSLLTHWHTAASQFPGRAEWLVRTPPAGAVADRLVREAAFHSDLAVWELVRRAAADARLTALDPVAFKPVADDLGARVADLDRRLAREADQLIAARPEFEGVVTPRPDAVTWWHAADAALTAPDANPERRANFLREYRRVSRQLFVTSQTRPETLPEVPPTDTRDRAFDAARRRGTAALARLGKEAFDGRPGEGYKTVEFQLNDWLSTSARKSLTAAGTRIGDVLAGLAADAKAAPPADGDRLARVLTPAGCAGLAENPSARLRRAGVGDLLLTQARRTLADHWYSDGGEPYYRRATEQLAADAANLTTPGSTGPSPFAAIVKATESFPAQSDLPPRFVFTDESRLAAKATLTPVAGVSGRPGFVTLRADPPFPGAEAGRTPAVPVAPNATPSTLALPLARPAAPPPGGPVTQSGQLRLRGFFRGREDVWTRTVEVHSTPHQTAVTVPAADPFAKLAVRADSALAARYAVGAGSVAVVLDCSGSMRPDPAVPGNRGLYPQAVDALRDVLASLPPGTIVGVRTFGRRTPGARAAEDTIRDLLPPVKLPLDPAPTVDEIVARAAAVTIDDLYDRSPVVRSVLAARESVKAAPGPFRAVVLISDAVDTRFPEDPDFAGKTVKDVLRTAFGGGDVPLAVVALPVTVPVEVAAQKEFEVVTTLRPAGLFVPPAQAGRVGQWLRSGLSPRVRYTVEPIAPASPVDPFDLTAATDPPDDWYPGHLPPGRYRLRMSGVADFAHDLLVRPGDRLLAHLTEDGGRLSLRRYWYPANWPALARSPGAGPQLALLQNRPDGVRVKMVAAVEPPPGPEAVVAPVRTGEVWFDITPAVPNADPVAVRWRPAPGFPGPTWAVDVAGWPAVPGGKGLAAPNVRAWWPAGGAFRAEPERWKRPTAGWLKAETTEVAGGAATILSATAETHPVEVRPGVVEPRPCLAVRLKYPPGQPAWVRPVGTEPPVGGEVRVFAAAGRVTCLFWWDSTRLTDEVLSDRVSAFEVVTRREAPDVARLDLREAPPPADDSPVVTPPAGR
jgi:hypothetical protein